MALFDFFLSEKSIFRLILTKGAAAPAVAAAAAAVAAIGLAIGSFRYYPVFGQDPDGEHEQQAGFDIRGDALIKAYYSDETLYRIWEGDNSLTAEAVNAIVSCAIGISTEPFGYGKCNSWMTAIEIAQTIQQPDGETKVFSANTTATSDLIPQGCNPNSPTLSRCIGCQSQATFDDEISREASINSVRGFDDITGYPFDSLDVSEPIRVASGDTLNVRIEFSME